LDLTAHSIKPRRLPAPWRVDEREESFIVRDANDLPLAYLYFEDDFKRNWATLEGKLTKDEARRVATAIARLPDLLRAEKHREAGSAIDGDADDAAQ
jgi:hypothetical protein